MRILLLGASGRTGLRVIDEAVARGHDVTALARNPLSIPVHSRVTRVQGSPLRAADMAKAFGADRMSRPDAVIVTLNPCRTSDSPFAKPVAPPRLLADSVANAVQAMRERDVRKIVIMQALGVGDSFPSLSLLMRWVSRYTYMAASYKDHNLVDQEIKTSGLDYVLARPPWLTNGEHGKVKVFGNEGDGIGSFATISRKSVASFLVSAAEQDDWNRTTPVIASSSEVAAYET